MSTQGQRLKTEIESYNRDTYLISMQDQQTLTDQGYWVDTRRIKNGSFEFVNDAGQANSGNDMLSAPTGTISAFTAQIQASNAADCPSNSVDGTVIGSNVTALGMVQLTVPARWYKVKITALTASGGASLGVRLHGQAF